MLAATLSDRTAVMTPPERGVRQRLARARAAAPLAGGPDVLRCFGKHHSDWGGFTNLAERTETPVRCFGKHHSDWGGSFGADA
jgi:hypothetical protein